MAGYFDNQPEHNGRHHDRLRRRGQRRSCPAARSGRPVPQLGAEHSMLRMQLQFGKREIRLVQTAITAAEKLRSLWLVLRILDMSDSHASGTQSFLTPRCSRSVRVGDAKSKSLLLRMKAGLHHRKSLMRDSPLFALRSFWQGEA